MDRVKKWTKVSIDLDALPPDLAEEFIEARKPYRHKPATVAKWKRSMKRKKRARQKLTADLAEELRPRGVWDVDSGRMARVHALAGDWITIYEMRQILPDIPPNGLKAAVRRLWERGALLKRLNPSRAENPRRVSGVAACTYQFKRSEGEDPDKDDAGRKDEIEGVRD